VSDNVEKRFEPDICIHTYIVFWAKQSSFIDISTFKFLYATHSTTEILIMDRLSRNMQDVD